jgi:histidyl-tRNA synthetase
MSGSNRSTSKAFQAPRGTRDFYPEEMLRRRWIEDSWRRTAVLHGFEEIDGPRFEHLDLYTVKSGEGIVSELFSFTRAGGETTFALRPEFTPTAARMVAARASSLPKPIKWFSVGPYFRAERPQRGRLREFLQWNVDIFGDDSARADAEIIACCADLLASMGLSHTEVRIEVSNRQLVTSLLSLSGVSDAAMDQGLALLDRRDRLRDEEFKAGAQAIGLVPNLYDQFAKQLQDGINKGASGAQLRTQILRAAADGTGQDVEQRTRKIDFEYLKQLRAELQATGAAEWCRINLSVVRGLAYYTGMVFEVHEAGGKERAIAGGGRYDGLVGLFGGPATPAVGFAMGDVVLSLVLEDSGRMPEAGELRRRTGQRVDVFVITGDERLDRLVRAGVAFLRREGLQARSSAKATRNVGKLLKEASGMDARCCAIIESEQEATLKFLDTGEQRTVSLANLANEVRSVETAP